MAELLDRPAPFTDPQKAREAGLRSAEIRQQTQQELANLRFLLQTKPIEQNTPKPVDSEVCRQIELTNELVACARAELKRIQEDTYGFCEECKRHGADAKDQAALLRELRGLMEHLCRLHNIAQAPTSKANPKPAKSTWNSGPVGPAPEQPANGQTGDVQGNPGGTGQ